MSAAKSTVVSMSVHSGAGPERPGPQGQERI